MIINHKGKPTTGFISTGCSKFPGVEQTAMYNHKCQSYVADGNGKGLLLSGGTQFNDKGPRNICITYYADTVDGYCVA